MFNNKLTELLKTFSRKELEDFKEFLQSAYFNKRKAVTDIFEILSEYHPEYEFDLNAKEIIFERIFPGKKYNDSTLRVLLHYLSDLSEKFLVHNKLKNDELEFSVHLTNELCLRKQYRQLPKILSRSEDVLETRDLDAEDYYYFKYKLSNEKTKFIFESNYALYEKIIGRSDWETVFRDFTKYYHVKSMLMYLNSISFQTQYKKDFKSEAFTDMIENIRPDEYENNPIIEIYFNILKMKTNTNDESYYYKVKTLVQKNKKSLNQFDLTGAYIQLSQYCLKKISEGFTKFEKESFEIYKEELKEKTYRMNDGSMAPLFYKNVVKSGLILKELDWVKNFIYEYKGELSKSFRDNYFHFCLALYEFQAGNFGISMELNSKIKYDELYMKVNSKLLHMQLLYETNGHESLISFLESFRHFLVNNKIIPADRKSLFSNFQKYLSKIIIYGNNNDKTKAGLLYKDLLREKVVANKDWLLEKTALIK